MVILKISMTRRKINSDKKGRNSFFNLHHLSKIQIMVLVIYKKNHSDGENNKNPGDRYLSALLPHYVLQIK